MITDKCIASYGSLARFRDTSRIRIFNSGVVLGFGGDVSDMQYLERLLHSLQINQEYQIPSTTSPESTTLPAGLSSATEPPSTIEMVDANAAVPSQSPPSDSNQHGQLSANNLHKYLTKVMYGARSKMDPLWNTILVAGFSPAGPTSPTNVGTSSTNTQSDQASATVPFLASVDLLGTHFTSPTICTGMGAHIAIPIMRRYIPDEAAVANIDKEQGLKIIRECMKVLFYRDTRAFDKFTIAIVSKDKGVEIFENEKVEGMSWAFAEKVMGYGTQNV